MSVTSVNLVSSSEIVPTSGGYITKLPVEIFGKIVNYLEEKDLHSQNNIPNIAALKNLFLTSKTIKAFTYRALTFDSRFIEMAFARPHSKGPEVILRNLPHRPYRHLNVNLKCVDSSPRLQRKADDTLEFQNRAEKLLSLGGKVGLHLEATHISDSECTALNINRFVRLAFIRCAALTPQFFEQCNYHTHLERLELEHAQIDAKGLKNVLTTCNGLQTLVLTNCSNLTASDFLQTKLPRNLEFFFIDECFGFASVSHADLVQANNGLSQAILAMRAVYENPEEAKEWIKKGRQVLPALQLFTSLEKEMNGTLSQTEQLMLWHMVTKAGDCVTASVKLCWALLKFTPDVKLIEKLDALHKKFPHNELVMKYLAAGIVKGSQSGRFPESIQERLPEAKELLEKIISLNPKDDLALASLAWALFMSEGSIELAISYSQQALDINPQNSLALSFRLGAILNKGDESLLEHREQVFAYCERYLSLIDDSSVGWGIQLLHNTAEIGAVALSLTKLWFARAWGDTTSKKIFEMLNQRIAADSSNQTVHSVKVSLISQIEAREPCLSEEDKAYFREQVDCMEKSPSFISLLRK